MLPDTAHTTAGADSGLVQAVALTEQAEALLRDGRSAQALDLARQAASLAPDLERPWCVLAKACEAEDDLAAALAAYSQVTALTDDLTKIGASLGRVALELGEHALAESVLSLYMRQAAPTAEVIAHLARAQAAQAAYDRAQATLTSGLEADPSRALLWRSLGDLLCLQGRHAQSLVFFEEALRLDPGSAPTRSGLADALLCSGADPERALELSTDAFEADRSFGAGHARRLLAVGQLAPGWEVLAGHAQPGGAGVETKVAAPFWTPGASLDGRLLLMGEPELADELLLTQVVADLISEGLPVILAIAPQWVNLAQRSFPKALVVPRLSRIRHGRLQQAANLDSPQAHGGEPVAAWAPLRAMLPTRRGSLQDFAGAQPYLRPESRRVRHWREWLASLGRGPKVGLCWRQPQLDVARPGDVPSLHDLQGPLSNADLRIVSLQHGEVMGEEAFIQAAHGVEIHRPPGFDREDLDDLAALTGALDVVVGPPAVATYLAAACGAPTWFLASPRHWAKLGSEGYPWSANAMVIDGGPPDWSVAMAELGRRFEDLTEASAGGR